MTADRNPNSLNAALTSVVALCYQGLGRLIHGLRRFDENSSIGRRSPLPSGSEMTRGGLVLALLAAAQGRAYTPAQLQKAAFLVTRNLPQAFDRGETFDFQPYDYGPFDKGVYQE